MYNASTVVGLPPDGHDLDLQGTQMRRFCVRRLVVSSAAFLGVQLLRQLILTLAHFACFSLFPGCRQ